MSNGVNFKEIAVKLRKELDAERAQHQRLKNDTWGLEQALRAEVEGLKDMIGHAWVHSGYTDCGSRQMTTQQRELYQSVIAERTAKLDAEYGQ